MKFRKYSIDSLTDFEKKVLIAHLIDLFDSKSKVLIASYGIRKARAIINQDKKIMPTLHKIFLDRLNKQRR